MNRIFATLAFALLLLNSPLTASAAAGDAVSGTGIFFLGDQRMSFTVSAHSGPAGEDAQGELHFRVGAFADATADVTCLRVTGNRAIVAGKVRQGTTLVPGYDYLYLIVQDNGEPIGGEPVDKAGVLIATADFDCGFLDVINTLDNGNITVEDR